MPWNQTSPMDQKTQFIADYLRQTFSISALCEQYGISRKTGYKWIDRYLTLGPAGLDEHSRRPRSCPRETPEHVVTCASKMPTVACCVTGDCYPCLRTFFYLCPRSLSEA